MNTVLCHNEHPFVSKVTPFLGGGPKSNTLFLGQKKGARGPHLF